MEVITIHQEQKKSNKAIWLIHVEGENGGMFASQYCRENGISVHQFKYWQYRLALQSKKSCKKTKKLPASSFMLVTVNPIVKQIENGSHWIVYIGSKCRIKIQPLEDEGRLKKILHCLAEIWCIYSATGVINHIACSVRFLNFAIIANKVYNFNTKLLSLQKGL